MVGLPVQPRGLAGHPVQDGSGRRRPAGERVEAGPGRGEEPAVGFGEAGGGDGVAAGDGRQGPVGEVTGAADDLVDLFAAQRVAPELRGDEPGLPRVGEVTGARRGGRGGGVGRLGEARVGGEGLHQQPRGPAGGEDVTGLTRRRTRRRRARIPSRGGGCRRDGGDRGAQPGVRGRVAVHAQSSSARVRAASGSPGRVARSRTRSRAPRTSVGASSPTR